ncbi:MAG: hypothetical protein AABZ30_10365, partial [Myxococcota bacterium]
APGARPAVVAGDAAADAFARPFTGRLSVGPVAVVPADEAGGQSDLAAAGVVAVAIGAGADDPWRFAAVARAVGSALWTSSGVGVELHARFGLRPRVPLLPAVGGERGWSLGWREIVAPFGAWLPEIFADATGTLALGPAYVTAMIEELAPPQGESAIARVALSDESGTAFGPHPPDDLRVWLACRQLEQGHPAEARDLWSDWARRAGEADAYALPCADGGIVSVDPEPLRETGERLVSAIVDEPRAAFGGLALAGIPGLAFGAHEQAQARRTAEVFLRGVTPAGADPRIALAGAILASRARPELAARIAAALLRALGGDTQAHRRAAPAAPSAGPARPRPLVGPIDLSPRALREAIILQAILR